MVVTGSEVPGDWQAVAAPAVLAEYYLWPQVVSLRGGADAGGRATERLADSPHRTRDSSAVVWCFSTRAGLRRYLMCAFCVVSVAGMDQINLRNYDVAAGV